MAGYTKLFTRILDSTIWREPDETRILWITMLALADQDGIVQSTIPGLADRARISLEECERSLERFQQPDKYSWSKEEEGRRIKVVDGGWFLINHSKYRALLSKEDQAEKTRLRVQKYRALRKIVTDGNGVVTPSNASNDKHIQKQKHIQKHLSSKPLLHPTIEQVTEFCSSRGNGIDPQQWFDYYSANGWKVGRNSMKDWQAAVRTWEKNGKSNGGSNGTVRESKGELLERKNKEVAERCRRELTDGDRETLF